MQDVIINCMEDSIYQLTSDVLELTCTISPSYIAGGVYFLLVLHLWYWVMGVVRDLEYTRLMRQGWTTNQLSWKGNVDYRKSALYFTTLGRAF